MLEIETAVQDLATQKEIVPPPDLRSLEEIKTEIIRYQRSCEQSYLEMGRLLLEAKQHFGKHGEWITWLQDNVDMSICKAQRLIKVAKWLEGKTAPVPHLNFTKAYILSRLTESELKSFLQNRYHVGGQFAKNVVEMNKRELEIAVRSYLRLKIGKSSVAQGPQQAEAHASTKTNLLDRFDRIRADVSELADLVENGSGEYIAFAAELCQLCQNIVQQLSPGELEDT